MKRKMTIAMLAALTLAVTACSANTSANNSEATEAATEAEDTFDESDEADDESKRGTGDEYVASEAGVHAIEADGTDASYDNISVIKTGDAEQGDENDFYGTNAAVIAQNGGSLEITNSKIDTKAAYGNAVFSYGEGSTVNISDSTITTSEHNSGGIMVTGGGTLNAENLHITTQGGSSAAIRSDRGGGTLTVKKGTYETNGSGSPAIYSTADITVDDATLISNAAQAVVVEGKNSVTLNNTEVTGNNVVQNSDKTDLLQAVMIYQSMSGDADTGKGVFTMNGGSLTSTNAGMFFVTNTVAEINLDNVKMTYATDDLLRIQSEGWGNDGENGGQVTLNAKDQDLEGIITVDENSNLNMYLSGSSDFAGSIDNKGKVYVELSDDATWTLTADTKISGLTCGKDAIKLNGHKLTVDGKEYEEGTESTGTAIETVVYEGHGAPEAPPADGKGGPGGSDANASGDKPGSAPDGKMAPPDGDGKTGAAPDGKMAPPDGDNKGGQAPDGNGEPPAKPDGNSEPPAKPDESTSTSADSGTT